jgi:protein involved in polysaccharide export with SLBB domain
MKQLVKHAISHRNWAWRGRGLMVMASLFSLAVGVLPAVAGTPVERGDVLYVSVSGAPEMTRDAKVDSDGRIRLPVLGGIDVAGADVDEVQRRIEAALVARDIMLSPVVLVEVSTYRPVYVGGAVKVSGEVPYQPGLTLRQAIIAAGGLDLLPGAKSADVGDIMELLARRQAAILKVAQSDSEIARLKAQVAEVTAPVQPDAGPLAAKDQNPDAGAFTQVDRDLLGALDTQRKSSRTYADTAVSLVQLELDVLTQQAELQSKERDLQHEDVVNTRVMVEKGLVPLPRLNDLQREESRLSRDLLENSAFVARARQAMENIRHETAAADEAARIQALEDYRRALQDHAALEAEIDIINGRLVAVGSIAGRKSELGDIVPDIVVHRRVNGVGTQISLTMDSDVQPGDVIDVSLPEIPHG